jgi:hypothetical protein
MRAAAVFVCDCGVRLHILTEGRESGVLRCPNVKCEARHVIRGRVCEIQVDRGGRWEPCTLEWFTIHKDGGV